MDPILQAALPLFVLLNPFMLWVYLQDMLQGLSPPTVRRVLLRAGATSSLVFVFFAWSGDALFADVLQVRFASFLLFGGIIFLVIGVRFVVVGAKAKRELVGGAPEHVAGSIAMPFMIGPGTVSASVFAGEHAGGWAATAAITLAVAVTIAIVLLIRALHNHVAEKYAAFVDRYTDLVGRISALVIGTIAVDMILRGIDLWRAQS